MNSSGSNADIPSSSSSAPLTAARFATDFQDCYDRLWLLAAGLLGDRHLAEDVVQDAVIVALRQLNKFEVGTSFVAWMSQIVRFQAYNQSRKRTRRSTRSVDPVSLDAEAGKSDLTSPLPDGTSMLPPEQTFFDDEVVHALHGLRDVARASLLLRTVHQLGYADIAAMLGIAEGTAMSHVHRAKSQVRKALAEKINHLGDA